MTKRRKMSDNQNISINDALICISIFTGKPKELINFSNCCEEAKFKDPINKITYNTVNELIKDLEKVCVPSKTLFQLQGELERMFQKDDKLEVDFVNRLWKEAKEIVEFFKSNNPTATPNEIQINEIDQRMSRCDNVTEVLGKAIEIERRLIARKGIRKDQNSTKIEEKKNKDKNKPVKFVTNRLNNDKDKNLNNNSQEKTKIICHSCNKPGNIKKNCREKNNNNSKENCQLCNETGHTAKNCFKNSNRVSSNVKYQISEKNGHIAETCRFINDSNESNQSKSCKFCKKSGHDISTCFRLEAKKYNGGKLECVSPDERGVRGTSKASRDIDFRGGNRKRVLIMSVKVENLDDLPYIIVGKTKIYVNDPTTIDKRKIVKLHGIANVPITTLGRVKVKLFNKETVCHVISDTLGIPYAGLVGSRFFATHEVSNTTENEMGLKIPTLFIQSVGNIHDPKIDQEEFSNRDCKIETQSDINELNFEDFNTKKILSIVEDFENDKRFKNYKVIVIKPHRQRRKKKCRKNFEKICRSVSYFRKLNETAVTDAYPLSNITDVLDQLGCISLCLIWLSDIIRLRWIQCIAIKRNFQRSSKNKCEFLRTEVNYRGHNISNKGLKPDLSKLDAVENFPVQKTQKNIRAFLGFTGYYRRFFKNFSKITKPLTRLLEKNRDFEWSQKAQSAFVIIKEALWLLAIVQAVKNFRPYIYGHKFTLVTDHKPLIWFQSEKEANARILKWRLKLAEYNHDVVNQPGKIILNADALSRNPVEIANVTTRAQAKVEKEKKDCSDLELQMKNKVNDLNDS
ncbi:CinsV21_orph2 protein [Chelonus insularis]|nr:CinsV21_orph2 protein [Chelonus insularis]